MRDLVKRIAGSLDVAIGIVLIWRGLWVLLDRIEYWLFGHDTLGLAVASILVGLFLVYIHDHKVDELGHI